jgi:hypothetical protein
VERGPQGVCLVDLKTGASPSPPQGLPPEHRAQLLVYAVLYWAATGEQPNQVAVQYLDGVRIAAAIDWTQAEELVAEILLAREELNALIGSDILNDWNKLARPDQRTCRHCDYQPVCGPFFSEVAPGQPDFEACAVGRVEGVTLSDETAMVRLRVEAPLCKEESAELNVVGVPTTAVPPTGRRLSVCGAARTTNGSGLRVNWQSRTYVWPDRA